MATGAPSPGYPRPFRWTCDLFQKVSQLGVFDGRRVMLIDGVLYEEGPEPPAHGCSRGLAADAFYHAFAGCHLRQRQSLILGDATNPIPDVYVVRGGIRDYSSAHPTAAVFVIEVADFSLLMDTSTKSELYATAGVPDYWVLDIVNRQLHVFRDPQPSPADPGKAAYRTRLVLNPDDKVSPLAAPGAAVTVSDLLP